MANDISDELLSMLRQGAQRLLVVKDIGEVNKGDHIIVFADCVVAVDTSRRPDDVSFPRPVPSERMERVSRTAKPKKPPAADMPDEEITPEHVLEKIREHQPITSLYLSDKLGLGRANLKARGRITHILKNLCVQGTIRRATDSRLPAYAIVESDIPGWQEGSSPWSTEPAETETTL